MKINEYECKMCGKCCRYMPCELIPTDIPVLLQRFQMSFKEFFMKYLIAIPCTCGDKADVILRLSPVRVKACKRYNIYIENQDYVDDVEKEGECVFLQDNKCLINDIKPFGGKFMKCSKMTGGLTLQLTNSQYFIYWYNNQQIFYELSDEIEMYLKKAENLYSKADHYYELFEKSKRSSSELIESYEKYSFEAERIMKEDVVAAFNNIK